MARRRVQRFVRPPARSMIWLSIDTSTTVIASNASVLLTTLNAGALALRPFTIVRTRAVVSWSSDQFAATEFPRGVYGRMVVTDKAASVGIGSVPAPITETDSAWMVYQPLMDDFIFLTSAGFKQGVQQYTIDSKAMRKVGNDEDVVGVVQETGVQGAQISVLGRFLVKLH